MNPAERSSRIIDCSEFLVYFNITSFKAPPTIQAAQNNTPDVIKNRFKKAITLQMSVSIKVVNKIYFFMGSVFLCKYLKSVELKKNIATF